MSNISKLKIKGSPAICPWVMLSQILVRMTANVCQPSQTLWFLLLHNLSIKARMSIDYHSIYLTHTYAFFGTLHFCFIDFRFIDFRYFRLFLVVLIIWRSFFINDFCRAHGAVVLHEQPLFQAASVKVMATWGHLGRGQHVGIADGTHIVVTTELSLSRIH